MPNEVEMLLQAALQARRESRPADAKRDLEQALALCGGSGATSDLARTLKALGQIERDMGHPEVALPLYEKAATIYRADDDQLALAHTIRHVADIERTLGHPDFAEPGYREAIAIYRAHPGMSTLDLANAIRGLAILMFDTGKNDEAKVLWHEAHDLYAAVNVQAGVIESSRRLALLAGR